MGIFITVLIAIACLAAGFYFGRKTAPDQDSDGLTKEEKEQVRQILTMLTWNGINDEN